MGPTCRRPLARGFTPRGGAHTAREQKAIWTGLRVGGWLSRTAPTGMWVPDGWTEQGRQEGRDPGTKLVLASAARDPRTRRDTNHTTARKMSSSGGGGAVKTPSDFLKSIRGRPVVVKLNSGVDYRGQLTSGPPPCSLPFSRICKAMLQTLPREAQPCLFNSIRS